ncbi:tripartite tricarboxylate transporter TctB family protein [Kerstersia similis]|uniref:tripartite tricarboxylate transporter TctB family protein n=1 Tax=Kerstersia similis TaxID=206505 RepID=UPI0039EE2ACC
MKQQAQRQAGELVFVILLLGLAAFLLWHAYDISGFESLASAGSFPMAAAFLMVICALHFVWRTIKASPAFTGSVAAEFFRKVLPPVVLWVSLAMLAYMVLMERLGFLLSSYLFLVCTMLLLGSRRLWITLLVPAVFLGVIHLVFETLFSVILPAGTWLQGI